MPRPTSAMRRSRRALATCSSKTASVFPKPTASNSFPSVRVASAAGKLRCTVGTFEKVRSGAAPKGSVVGTAEIAGIMAAKRTAELIPLCHPLPLGKVEVRITIDEALPGFRVEAEVRT